jgi:hypothetical protein
MGKEIKHSAVDGFTVPIICYNAMNCCYVTCLLMLSEFGGRLCLS